ncbi:hypothetical protein CVT25_013019 [Psilocybe cyanescens]|uniref:Uncharacterized protein n=1 Tax=Psilocybe cyanescens TaxID=93625 RepID=A0A409XLY0_PSICY|nr:hypothetical protein CVT25_013019 [Psilocybe cyanescens]
MYQATLKRIYGHFYADTQFLLSLLMSISPAQRPKDAASAWEVTSGHAFSRIHTAIYFIYSVDYASVASVTRMTISCISFHIRLLHRHPYQHPPFHSTPTSTVPHIHSSVLTS